MLISEVCFTSPSTWKQLYSGGKLGQARDSCVHQKVAGELYAEFKDLGLQCQNAIPDIQKPGCSKYIK